jgi:hypothetical protein
LQDAPGDLESHLLHRQTFGVLIGDHRPVRLTEVLAHGNRRREPDVNLAVVALALCLDEVVQPGQTLGCLLASTRVRGVLGCLVQLVEADRYRLQQDVVAAAVEIGVGDVGQQTELGRQHLSGARARSLDRPAEVEALFDDVADELPQHVLVQRVVELAADEDDTGVAHQRPHEPERQVDARERVHRR